MADESHVRILASMYMRETGEPYQRWLLAGTTRSILLMYAYSKRNTYAPVLPIPLNPRQ